MVTQFTNDPVPARGASIEHLLRQMRQLWRAWVDPAAPPPGKPASRLPLPAGAGLPADVPADVPAGLPADAPSVLVVDDNPVNLSVVSEMLSRLGIRPLLAADGGEAVALALELRLDLVLMDLQMPVLDGFEATCQIRDAEREHGRVPVPIVAYTLSPHVDPEHLQACGFDGLLRKPCEEQALLECLQRWCASTGGWTGRATGQSPHFGAATDSA